MLKRGIILLLLATLLAGNALCNAESNVTTITASEDVYISMGENRVSVYNQTEMLLCAVDVTGNRTEMVRYPGAPVIQFDISGLNITDNDVAILVLKAASMQKQNDPVMVALMSIGSDWDESSDYTTFLVNILPAWNIIKKNDATAMSSNTDGDRIFAFDVSQKLRDARAKGDKISFLLEAISNSSAEISFLPRESGQGPCLMIMPYPVSTPDVTMPSNLTLNSSLQTNQTTVLSENINQTEPQTDTPTALQTILAGKRVPVAGRWLSNVSLE
ncbi:MAG: hypothetical protein NTX42_02165 [Methanothrix sp.]|nr:hypothetical protein [Methanothrix sp.]